MSVTLPSWPRKHYTPSGEAVLFYVAFGSVARDASLDAQRYRCEGTPAGVELLLYDKRVHPAVFAEFLKGFAWEELKERQPHFAQTIEQCSRCVVLRAFLKDPPTLDYLRDCVGLLTFFLDQGACAIYDPQVFHFWTPQEWRQRVFDPAAPVPRHHVAILLSEEQKPKGLVWVHTRGMRKFGRPDISVRRVSPDYVVAVTDLCERFIEMQAFGAVIPEGQEIRMEYLPPGGVARHAGHLDDPEFNNVHVEIVWPGAGLSRMRGP